MFPLARSICIHGHFYQPPRENPWLEEIEIQESAAPWHDWNERITAECYGPNGAARILAPDGWIRSIVNNYSRISHNFGPTLLSWLEKKHPGLYEKILRADREGAARFSGHGPAIAQAYNHIILPLASRRDKITQVLWGLEDFRSRYGRDPEGMWLPETAVDTETLEILADCGIRFTILAPRQGEAVRQGGGEWTDVRGEGIDTTLPYSCALPSGRSIALFFYCGPLAQQVAFGEALRNGGAFASMLMGAFPDPSSREALVSVATDGETFGHHHKYGDMALAYCLDEIEKSPDYELTVYGEYLEQHPPQNEVSIAENSSWSCVHGVERWRNDCGCSARSLPGWNQRWRKPLREALDFLRDSFLPFFLERGRVYFLDPDGTRNRYISVLLGRESPDAFADREAGRELSPGEKTEALILLEMERNLLLMYTSCGFFFGEISGIETLQVMAYAERALELGGKIFPLFQNENLWRARLAQIPSNIAELRDGLRIRNIFIEPLKTDLLRLGANFAVSSLFAENGGFRTDEEGVPYFAFHVMKNTLERINKERKKYILGSLRIRSDRTLEEEELFAAALYRGGRNVLCGVAPGSDDAELVERERVRISAALQDEDEEVLVARFGHTVYSLRHLFRDEQRRIVKLILAEDLAAITKTLRKAVDDYSGILSFLASLSMPAPEAFRGAAEVILNDDLKNALEAEIPDIPYLRRALENARRWGIEPDLPALSHGAVHRIESLLLLLEKDPGRREILEHVIALLSLVREKGWEVNLWDAENRFKAILSLPEDIPSSLKDLYESLGALLTIRPSDTDSFLTFSEGRKRMEEPL